ncbi:unnamed protein product [Ambrosiozyma monospora]|uniref:Unnamed protein product n=1 Tax=Ambrosiozyma monospora TaxID=43982 RepID=A0ACB5T2T8_AMBMO|nr:unnamed protein product [Ambrosiozyma monospora]
MWSSKWIPITSDGAGDYECIDLNPTWKGRWGQVILRTEASDFVLQGKSFKDYFSKLVKDVLDGKYDDHYNYFIYD